MKKLLHSILILTVLATVTAGIAACSDDLQETNDVEVNFIASIPADLRTRSFGDGTGVNTLVVGVFKDNGEIARKSFAVNGATVDVRLTLAQNQTYSFVFWAYNSDCGTYDMTDLTAIKMNALEQPVTFRQAEAADAFFAVKEHVAITQSGSRSVSLVRPLAQINVGTTGEPEQAALFVKEVPDTFHPFDNTVSGSRTFVWEFAETTAEKFTADGTEYNYLAIGYLFAPPVSMQVEAGLTLQTLTFNFPQVELQSNCRSNIAGKFTEGQ